MLKPKDAEKLASQLDFIEHGGCVVRCHTVPTLHPQNVAAHSFGVAWWCWILSCEAPSAVLLMAALQHDIAEHTTGDIPAPTKYELNIRGAVQALEEDNMTQIGKLPLFVLNKEEEVILKLADSLELAQHCLREMWLGNRCIKLGEMFHNACQYVDDQAQAYEEISPYHEDLLNAIIEIIQDKFRRLK